MSKAIRAVVFDFGGVLTLPPTDRDLEKLRQLTGLDASTFVDRFASFRGAYDSGLLNSREYWARVIDSRGNPPDADRLKALFETDVAGWTRINEAVLQWAFRLQERGMRTGILSNMPRDLLRWIRRRFAWIERFEPAVFSCDLGFNKPQAEIYRACLQALGLAGSEVLFLDDRQENVAGAERLGIRALLFRNLPDALTQISAKRYLSEHLPTGKDRA
jgi:putative hydrolase of the HAD superfamily